MKVIESTIILPVKLLESGQRKLMRLELDMAPINTLHKYCNVQSQFSIERLGTGAFCIESAGLETRAGSMDDVSKVLFSP